MKKRKHIFVLLYPVCLFFCILNLKILAKKDKNEKNGKNNFSNSKNIYAKRSKIIFQKKHAKKNYANKK